MSSQALYTHTYTGTCTVGISVSGTYCLNSASWLRNFVLYVFVRKCGDTPDVGVMLPEVLYEEILTCTLLVKYPRCQLSNLNHCFFGFINGRKYVYFHRFPEVLRFRRSLLEYVGMCRPKPGIDTIGSGAGASSGSGSRSSTGSASSHSASSCHSELMSSHCKFRNIYAHLTEIRIVRESFRGDRYHYAG